MTLDDVEIGPSQTGGLGVFAKISFKANDTIRRRSIVREITRASPLQPGENCNHTFKVNGRTYLAGLPDCYVNHSCDPTTYLRYRGEVIELVARRAISPGEELTLDYLINNDGGESWWCRCGCARCRGNTGVSFFDLPEPFQTEYLPLLADWFVMRHTVEIIALRKRLREGP